MPPEHPRKASLLLIKRQVSIADHLLVGQPNLHVDLRRAELNEWQPVVREFVGIPWAIVEDGADGFYLGGDFVQSPAIDLPGTFAHAVVTRGSIRATTTAFPVQTYPANSSLTITLENSGGGSLTLDHFHGVDVIHVSPFGFGEGGGAFAPLP